MTNRSSPTRMVTRSRGGKRKPVQIKVKLARVVPNQRQNAVVRNRDNTAGVYDGLMVYVQNQHQSVASVTTRKRRGRGRPKKTPGVVESARQIASSSTEIIYLPSVSRPAIAVGTARAPLQTAQRVSKPQNDQIDWPEDLQDLVDNWEKTPENNLRLLVKWMTNPSPDASLPPTVQSIHQLVNEIPGPEESRIDEVTSILKEMAYPTPATPTVTQPKVVVEAEPVPLADCGQWTAMAEEPKNSEQ